MNHKLYSSGSIESAFATAAFYACESGWTHDILQMSVNSGFRSELRYIVIPRGYAWGKIVSVDNNVVDRVFGSVSRNGNRVRHLDN
jgi:hypothetical protein